MLGFVLLGLGLVALAVATKGGLYATTTVNPFTPVRPTDPTVETLALGSHAATTLAGDWHAVELDNLTDVEDLLDSLEAAHAHDTELEMAGSNKFTVRWR